MIVDPRQLAVTARRRARTAITVLDVLPLVPPDDLEDCNPLETP